MGQLGCAVKVLIVDDCHDSAWTLSRVLTLHGYESNCANSGKEALVLANTWLPDVVIMDMSMPGPDGYETARSMRQLPGMGNVRVIALSGNIDNVLRRETSGIHEHLMKPTAIPQLLAILKAFKSVHSVTA